MFDQELKRQLSKCIHFNGIGIKECKAGINYDTFRGEEKPYKWPCLCQGGHCPKFQLPTPEQAAKEAGELLELSLKGMKAADNIRLHHHKNRKELGEAPCPCGGVLQYFILSNGHIRAFCPSCKLSIVE